MIVAYSLGTLLFVFALVDRHHGDGPVASDVELAAGLVCFVIGYVGAEIIDAIRKPRP